MLMLGEVTKICCLSKNCAPHLEYSYTSIDNLSAEDKEKER